MKNLVNGFLGLAMLGASCVFAFTGESTIGKPVDDSVAATIRGGACDSLFITIGSPVYCEGGGCHKQRPNIEINGFGFSGYGNESCAGAVPGFNCSSFHKAVACAKDATAIVPAD